MNLNFNLLLLISEFITLVSLEAFFPRHGIKSWRV